MELQPFCSSGDLGHFKWMKYAIISRLCSVFILRCTNKRHFYSVNLSGQLGSAWKNVCTSRAVVLLHRCFCCWTTVPFVPHPLHDIFLWNTHCESFLHLHRTMPCCRTAAHRPGFESCQTLLLGYAPRHRIAAILQWFTAWWVFDIKVEIVAQFYAPYKFIASLLGHVPYDSLIQAREGFTALFCTGRACSRGGPGAF